MLGAHQMIDPTGNMGVRVANRPAGSIPLISGRAVTLS
jgi:hypothetical protein